MYPCSEAFHEAVRDGNRQLALMIFGDAVFSSEDDIDIDTGIEFDDNFNMESDLAIGQKTSNEIRFALINKYGYLNDYEFGEFTATIGVMLSQSDYAGGLALTYGGHTYAGGNVSGRRLTKDGTPMANQPGFNPAAMLAANGKVYCFSSAGDCYAVTVSDGSGETVLLNDFMEAKSSHWAGKTFSYEKDGNGYQKLYIREVGGYQSEFEFVPLGVFTAERPNVPDQIRIDIEGYDRMQKLEKDMPDEQTFGSFSTIGELFVKLCQAAEVPYRTATFINSTATVDGWPEEFRNATMRTVLGWIAEVAASNARFDRDGYLVLDWIRTTDASYDEDTYSELSVNWYETKKVGKLYNRDTGNATEDTYAGDGTQTGTENYLIQDNPLIRAVTATPGGSGSGSGGGSGGGGGSSVTYAIDDTAGAGVTDKAWSANKITGELAGKVDKVSGKGLSANDFTNALKQKLDGIAAGANNYSHPTATARTGKPTGNQTPGFGGTVTVSQVTSDANGHVSGMTDRTITIPDSEATTSAHGLMSAADKTKLNGIAAGAETNQHAFSNVLIGNTTIPATAKTDVIEIVAGSGVTLVPDAANKRVTISANGSGSGSTIEVATETTAGLMSAADKVKLNGIAAGAQVNSVTGVKGNAEVSYRNGNVNITKDNIGLGNAENKSAATILSEMTASNVTTALGYTPINPNEKGAALGVASLDSSGKILPSQMPTTPEEIVWANSFAAFPDPGTAGKLYIDKGANLIYLWNGTEYVELSSTAGLATMNYVFARTDGLSEILGDIMTVHILDTEKTWTLEDDHYTYTATDRIYGPNLYYVSSSCANPDAYLVIKRLTGYQMQIGGDPIPQYYSYTVPADTWLYGTPFQAEDMQVQPGSTQIIEAYGFDSTEIDGTSFYEKVYKTVATTTDLAAKAEIDDTAGDGDDDVTWSADKILEEMATRQAFRININEITSLPYTFDDETAFNGIHGITSAHAVIGQIVRAGSPLVIIDGSFLQCVPNSNGEIEMTGTMPSGVNSINVELTLIKTMSTSTYSVPVNNGGGEEPAVEEPGEEP